MPKGMKICDSCGKSNGCRTKICECGHEFGAQPKQERLVSGVKQTKHPLGQQYVPVPGLWVFDQPKGMPSIQAPDDLPSGPIDNREVYDQCVYHGVGECVCEYIPSRRIADPKLRKLWEKAHDAMHDAWRYLTDDN